MTIELPGFESNLMKVEIPVTIARSSNDKIRQIFDYIKTKKPDENDVDIIKIILESCKCHKYTENRFLHYRSFDFYTRRVTINSHVKESDQ